jgi:hypothetical protein
MDPVPNDSEVCVSRRVVAPLGRIDPSSEMFLQLDYTDNFFFASDGAEDIPCVRRIARPIAWSDACALLRDREATLVGYGPHRLEKSDRRRRLRD